MSDISKINPNGTEYNLKDVTARTNIGNLSNLETTEKTDLVSAVNEVKNSLTDLFITGHTTLTWNNYEGRLTKEILGVNDCKYYIWFLHSRTWENIISTSYIGVDYVGIRAWEKTTPNAEQISLKETGSLEIYWEGIYLGKSIEFP